MLFEFAIIIIWWKDYIGKIRDWKTNLEFKITEKDQSKNLFKVPLNSINTSSINKMISTGWKNSTANSQTQQDFLCEIRSSSVDVPKVEEQNAEEEAGARRNKFQLITESCINKSLKRPILEYHQESPLLLSKKFH